MVFDELMLAGNIFQDNPMSCEQRQKPGCEWFLVEGGIAITDCDKL